MFDFLYKNIYVLGLYTARYLSRFAKRVSSVVMKPLKALKAFAFAGLVYVKQYFSQRSDDAKELVDDMKKANADLFDEDTAKLKGFKRILYLIKRKLFKKSSFGFFATEIAAPAIAFAVLLITVNYWSSKNLALKITYNNADIGCVSSESIYLEAQEKASKRLQTAKVTGEGTAVLKNAQYTIVPVSLVDLKDSDSICNEIIGRSGSNITNACGIYIDGEFLGAVKNETDAQTVFDNILSSYNSSIKSEEEASDENAQDSDEKTEGFETENNENTDNDNAVAVSGNNNEGEDKPESATQSVSSDKPDETVVKENEENEDEQDSSATVSFAEDIEYVQGLYPDDENTIIDAVKLNEKLENNQKEAVYYIAHDGDTFAGVAGQYNISVSELRELNPDLSPYLKDGDRVLISKAQELVRIQVTRTETRTVELAYEVIEIETSSLYKGIKKTISEGVNGEQEITELVTYIGSERVCVEEISRVTTVEPVAKKVQVGTKKNPYGTATSYGGRFLWPAIGAYSISSYYGNRSLGWHGGIDIVKPGGQSTGLPIVAADDGVVVSAGYHYSWGYNIVISHGNGLSTRYAHMIQGSFKVSAGQKVYAGQVIGNIGSTGNVTGPHLHFEVMVNGTRVDPLPYLGR